MNTCKASLTQRIPIISAGQEVFSIPDTTSSIYPAETECNQLPRYHGVVFFLSPSKFAQLDIWYWIWPFLWSRGNITHPDLTWEISKNRYQGFFLCIWMRHSLASG